MMDRVDLFCSYHQLKAKSKWEKILHNERKLPTNISPRLPWWKNFNFRLEKINRRFKVLHINLQAFKITSSVYFIDDVNLQNPCQRFRWCSTVHTYLIMKCKITRATLNANAEVTWESLFPSLSTERLRLL